jgi:hypothetical protein
VVRPDNRGWPLGTIYVLTFMDKRTKEYREWKKNNVLVTAGDATYPDNIVILEESIKKPQFTAIIKMNDQIYTGAGVEAIKSCNPEIFKTNAWITVNDGIKDATIFFYMFKARRLFHNDSFLSIMANNFARLLV